MLVAIIGADIRLTGLLLTVRPLLISVTFELVEMMFTLELLSCSGTTQEGEATDFAVVPVVAALISVILKTTFGMEDSEPNLSLVSTSRKTFLFCW